ncbi:hypothetical protein [Streptomyces sp. NBC_00996]|uniref:hypothetical protein n=1 Tax=Streptomyces sp. NBC_00996 TaxID=2903710 RepID=UPI003869D743|nr:hypothetical protein OG390_24995 [Streptomyces sp. NBC_00996]
MAHTVPTPARPDEPLRELLAAVLEALDIPHPATVGDSEAHDRILIDRVMHAKIALHSVLTDDCPLGVNWNVQYLRERLAEHPPTGYVAYDQARASLAAGKSWIEAVQPAGGETR